MLPIAKIFFIAKMACPIEFLLYQPMIRDLINHKLDKIKEICKDY
jgi:hypothetical protein